MGHFISTEFVVLKKTPYKESSLIVSGLSPDVGKVDFIFKGAKRISRNSFPEIDYFRVFLTNFNDRGKNLITPESIDLLRTYDALAKSPEKLTEAFDIVPFVLRNKHYGVPCPIFYKSLLRYFDLLAKNEQSRLCFIKLAYLYENGLLPEELASSPESRKRSKNFLSLLMKHILDGSEIPVLTEEYYQRLEKWIDSLCIASELY